MNFFPVFIISMTDSNRVELIKSQLSRLGISFEIQDAVVGKNLTEREINNLVNLRGCDARLGYRISKNLIGSGLSHIEVYKKAYALGNEWTLILEEDVNLIELNKELIYNATSKLITGPVIIQLFSRASRLIKTSTLQEVEKNKFLFEFNKRIVGCGAAAYLINRETLKIALMHQKLDGAPDWPAWGKKIKFFGIYPWIFKETGDGSTVPVGSLSRTKNFKRRFSQLLGINYLTYRSEYGDFKEYLLEEILPYLLYIIWRITGSKYYKNDREGLQII
jgi:hypothetical protein